MPYIKNAEYIKCAELLLTYVRVRYIIVNTNSHRGGSGMKKYIYLILATFVLTGCSSSAYGKVEKIVDDDRLSSLDAVTTQAVEYYFDIDIDEDLGYTLEAFESYIPHNDDYIYHSNIFQAELENVDFVDGDIAGYGGIFDPVSHEVMGMVISRVTDKGETIDYTQDEIIHIALDFLKEKQLIDSTQTLTYVNTNEKASSEYLTVINLDSATHRYAVGVNLQYAKVVYFECALLEYL